MSKRPGNPSRRFGDGGGSLFPLSSHSKQKSSPAVSIGLVVFVGVVLLISSSFSNKGGFRGFTRFVNRIEGDYSCTMEVQRAIPVDGMHKVLHVGPETCSVVAELLKEEETEAWGVEPYDIEDADRRYTLDYLSPRYLNKTLPDLARVSADGLVIFTGYPGQQRAKVAEVSKLGRAAKLRSSSWWVRYFSQNNLELNEATSEKFDKAASKMSFFSSCQVFHLMPFHWHLELDMILSEVLNIMA